MPAWREREPGKASTSPWGRPLPPDRLPPIPEGHSVKGLESGSCTASSTQTHLRGDGHHGTPTRGEKPEKGCFYRVARIHLPKNKWGWHVHQYQVHVLLSNHKSTLRMLVGAATGTPSSLDSYMLLFAETRLGPASLSNMRFGAISYKECLCIAWQRRRSAPPIGLIGLAPTGARITGNLTGDCFLSSPESQLQGGVLGKARHTAKQKLPISPT